MQPQPGPAAGKTDTAGRHKTTKEKKDPYMKILHTSDWHLGHTLYNYDRTEEQSAMLQQMAAIVAAERPDLFLLCGDVYHTAQPSAAVQTMLTDALVRLHEAHPAMCVVITAGNHDSGTRHEIFRSAWRALNVHAVGSLSKERPDDHIIPVGDKGFVVAVPYANERHLHDGFFQELLDRAAERNAERLPVVLTAHTTVHGCDFSGHDHATEYTVGGIDALRVEQMGQGYDYLALGHIHREQWVHCDGRSVRYSGTPLAVSFDENYPHTVSMVEIDRHGDTPSVRTIPVDNARPPVTLPTKGTAPWEEAKALLRAFPDDIAAYIRLNVETDDFLPSEANAEAAALTQGKACRFCHINVKRKSTQRGGERTLTVQEFQAEAPLDIACRYAEDIGRTFDEEMKSVFNEAFEMVQSDMRN